MFHQFDEDELLDTLDTRSELHKTVQQSCINTLTEMLTLPENLGKVETRLRNSSGKLPKTQAKLLKTPPLCTENSTENCRPKFPENFHKARKLQQITKSS